MANSELYIRDGGEWRPCTDSDLGGSIDLASMEGQVLPVSGNVNATIAATSIPGAGLPATGVLIGVYNQNNQHGDYRELRCSTNGFLKVASESDFAAKNVGYDVYVAISPSDTTDEADAPFDALYVGVAGDIVIVKENDDEVTFTAVPVGLLPISDWKRINSTATSASDFIGLKYS